MLVQRKRAELSRSNSYLDKEQRRNDRKTLQFCEKKEGKLQTGAVIVSSVQSTMFLWFEARLLFMELVDSFDLNRIIDKIEAILGINFRRYWQNPIIELSADFAIILFFLGVGQALSSLELLTEIIRANDGPLWKLALELCCEDILCRKLVRC